MSVYKRPESVFYWCKFQHRGQRYDVTTRTVTKREAEAFERKYRTEIEAQDGKTKPATLIPDLTMAMNADIKRAQSEGRHERYITGGIRDRMLPFIEYFKNCAINDITQKDIEGYLNWRRGQVSGQTINREFTVLKRAMEWAYREYDIPPSLRYKPKVSKSPIHTGRRGKFLLAPGTWLNAIKKPEARNQAEFVLLTGIRYTELRKVKLEWIKYVDNPHMPALLEIPAYASKTGVERAVGLSHRALAAARSTAFSVDFKGTFATASKVSNIGYVVTLRDLRHTFATIAKSLVGDDTAVNLVMGHSMGGVQMRYQTATLDRLARVAAVMEAWLLKVIDTAEPKSE